jgi:hypothetical protein
MHTGKLVFAQVMSHLPPMVFERCVARYAGYHKVKSFTCMDQFLCMALVLKCVVDCREKSLVVKYG